MTTEFIHRNKAGVSLVGFLTISTIFLTLRVDPYISGIKATLWFFLSPGVVTNGKFFNRLDNLNGRLFRLVRAEAENTILRTQNAQLSKNLVERDSLEQENNRLRILLGLKEKEFGQSIVAEVLAMDPREWFHSLLINQGAKEGVFMSAAVVEGTSERSLLVGRIVEVNRHTSKVLLLTDVDSAVSVEINGKNELGLLEGRNSPTTWMRYLSQQSKVAVGDEVVTAGLGGIFPQGLIVGRVVSIKSSPDGFFKEAEVYPLSDFGSLREVLVVTRRERDQEEHK